MFIKIYSRTQMAPVWKNDPNISCDTIWDTNICFDSSVWMQRPQISR